MSTILKLNNVCKTYELGEEKVSAVCNANLEIKKGDFIAISQRYHSAKY